MHPNPHRPGGDTGTADLNSECLLLKAVHHISHSIWTKQLFPHKFTRGCKRKVVILTDGRASRPGGNGSCHRSPLLCFHSLSEHRVNCGKAGTLTSQRPAWDHNGSPLLRFSTAGGSLRAAPQEFAFLRKSQPTFPAFRSVSEIPGSRAVQRRLPSFPRSAGAA